MTPVLYITVKLFASMVSESRISLFNKCNVFTVRRTNTYRHCLHSLVNVRLSQARPNMLYLNSNRVIVPSMVP